MTAVVSALMSEPGAVVVVAIGTVVVSALLLLPHAATADTATIVRPSATTERTGRGMA